MNTENLQHESIFQTREGDLIQLVTKNNKTFLVRLVQNAIFESHKGVIEHNDLIGRKWGSVIQSHSGSPFYILQPSVNDLLLATRRSTQIMYPKDIGFIFLKMNIAPGTKVIEAGSGSGAMTSALAWAVGDTGKVFSYEIRPDMHALAKKNIGKLGLSHRVEFKLKDIQDGFDEQNADAIFLDVPNPYDYLSQVKSALQPGGFFGAILPTTNQVSILLDAFQQFQFAYVEVCELLLRHYKTVSERLRPTDRMVAHTGFLIFARSIIEE